jgi:hypothetical protein
MNEIPLTRFERAIHALHHADATLIERVRVTRYFEGKRVGESEVLAFELLGHPSATRCYAWEIDGEVTTVLNEGPINSALAAVRSLVRFDLPPGERPRPPGTFGAAGAQGQ